MLGMPRELWRNRWFADELARVCARPVIRHLLRAVDAHGRRPAVSRQQQASRTTTASGPTCVHRVELRKADVKFTPECLGFANMPEPQTVYAVTAAASAGMHDPRWKRRVPRDTGPAGTSKTCAIITCTTSTASILCSCARVDMPRYLQLSRWSSGEMMAQVFAEWRSAHSNNRGGLVWFYKDLWPGAGWGIVDSRIPKAAYYYLKRIWHSRQLTLTDEGLERTAPASHQ